MSYRSSNISTAIPTVTLSDDSSSDNDSIDIIEDLSKHSSNNNADIDDSNDSDCQVLEVVEGEIQVIVDKTGSCEIIEEKTASTSTSTKDKSNRSLASEDDSFSSTKTLKQSVSNPIIKLEINQNETIKTEYLDIDESDDSNGFFDVNDTVKTELIGDTNSTVVSDYISNNDLKDDNSVATITEKCDEMAIISNRSDNTVDDVNEVALITNEPQIDSILIDDNTAKMDNTSPQQLSQNANISLNGPILNINLNNVSGEVDNSTTDTCDTSFEKTESTKLNIPKNNTESQPEKGLKSKPKPRCKQKRPEDRYNCLKCDYFTWNLVDLMYHNSEHRNRFRCRNQLCTYQTDTREKLDLHVKKHESMRRLCFKCYKETDCDCGEQSCQNSVKLS